LIDQGDDQHFDASCKYVKLLQCLSVRMKACKQYYV